MFHQASSQHTRSRSQTVPSPHHSPPGSISGRRKPPPIQTATEASRRPSGPQTPARQFYNGAVGGHAAAAATAASAAYPKSTQVSPGHGPHEVPEKEHKLKSEKSKMKLFSKPKSTSNKESEKPLPSPNRVGPSGPSGLSKIVSPSVTSFADSLNSSASSIYTTNNTSTSTLVPLDRQIAHEKEKEKAHKHHFLSRQRNKLKDKIGDDHTLPLSSASSNSKPLDPNAPSSIYSFAPAPASPGFSSFSGLDLRHGGRALREKKKEEKSVPGYAPPFAPKQSDIDRVDWATGGALTGNTGLTPSLHGAPSGSNTVPSQSTLQGFGLNNMRPEDVWDFLKAKLLIVFEGEELRIPVEDLNGLVTIAIQRCVTKRTPTIITQDLRGLLKTGFVSMDHTLRGVPDHRLVPHLVEMWLFVFGTVLPYMQAVFLPLDLEFKGNGTIMTRQEATDFWGANPEAADHAFGNEFDVRRIVLLSYRDNVILAHYDALKSTFSRLSLDSINVGVSPVIDSFDGVVGGRPGTAASLDPGVSSFNSQGSTLLGDGGRSRATSNLSAPELPSFGSPPTRRQGLPDGAQVTETVGRMLQCFSVLASVQSGDGAQAKMEDLSKALKLNWLGRGRTGRNRRGFVGTRVQPARRGASGEAGQESNL